MKNTGIVLFFIYCFIFTTSLYSQSYKDGKAAFDIIYYHLNLKVNPEQHSIKGYNQINFSALQNIDTFSIQLDNSLTLDSVVGMDKTSVIKYYRIKNQVHIQSNKLLQKDHQYKFNVYYHGKPHTALNPPWEGGFVWSKDSLNNNWVGVACEGEGASLWWPCKDDPDDEPDSMNISITCPKNLYCVSNGTLEAIDKNDSVHTYHWKVHYPINNYNVTLNIANYAHFSDTLFRKDKSKLPLDYYVLSYNEDKAKQHFKQVKTILSVFEKYFGNYPFEKDGYALVETPYWGMEHQSAVAYGNKYRTNMGPYDFIIVHETAHEWWGNSITAKKMSELWIHEAFATYAESLLIEDQLGSNEAISYLEKQKLRIQNQYAILSRSIETPMESTDMYYKGSWMLHTMRNSINDDEKWFETIKKFSISNKYKILGSEDLINFFSNHLPGNLTPIFEQYLYKSAIPELHYSFKRKGNGDLILSYNWQMVDKKFNMPVWIEVKGKKILLNASTKKRTYKLGENPEEVVKFITQLQLFEAVQDD